MRARICLLLLTSLSTGLTAQSQNYYISPPGTETLEGNSSSSIMLNYALSQVMQVDNTLTGMKSPLITAMAFRRNINLTASATHTAEIEIKAGHADFAAVTNTYATNFKAPPTVVFPKQNINMDWTSPSPLTPAAYDVVFSFAAPFIYNQVDAFAWESNTTTGVAGPGYAQDWFSGTSPAVIAGPIPSVLGTGCTTPNGVMETGSQFTSPDATTLNYAFRVGNGPSSQAALLLVGLSDPNVPLFCNALRAAPVLNVPMGATDANGNVPFSVRSTTWGPSVADVSLFTQVLALDPTQASGVAMSNGLHSRTPRSPGGAGSYDIKRIFTLNAANTATGSNPSLSCVATKYIQ